MVESFQKAAHTMGKESRKLLCNASFCMFMDNFQSSRTFRIGSNEVDLSPKLAQPIIRLKAGKELPYPKYYLEVFSIDDLRAVAATLGVPIIELRSDCDGIIDLVAIDWSKDIGFFYRQCI